MREPERGGIFDSMATELWVVRHGETAWSRERRHTGLTDVPLTDEGRGQAAALRPWLTGHVFERVLTSPLGRARETCALAGCEPRAEVDDELREWDYGDYEGTTTAQIRERHPGWVIWRSDPPGGERLAQVAARCDHVLARLAAVQGDVLLFAHAHVLRVLTARWLGLEPAAARLFALEAGHLAVLGYEHDGAVMLRWNVAGERPMDSP